MRLRKLTNKARYRIVQDEDGTAYAELFSMDSDVPLYSMHMSVLEHIKKTGKITRDLPLHRITPEQP